MFKDTGLASKTTPIVLQPRLWTAGILCLVALALASQAGRVLWKDSLSIEGEVRRFDNGEPIGGAFVEVVWDEVAAKGGSRRLFRTVVQADDSGRYQADLPEHLQQRINEPLVRGQPASRVLGYTTRAYAPGFRHLNTSLLYHQGTGYLSSGWDAWSHSGYTVEMEEPDYRDRSGDVRLLPVLAPDQQRIRQLYGTYLSLQVDAGRILEPLERRWLNQLCQEADHLQLEREQDLQMREEICELPALRQSRQQAAAVAPATTGS